MIKNSVVEIIQKNQKNLHAIAIYSDGKSITYEKFFKDINQATNYLDQKANIRAGDKVIVAVNDSYDHIVLTFSLIYMGVISASALPSRVGGFKNSDFDYLITDTKSVEFNFRFPIIFLQKEWLSYDGADIFKTVSVNQLPRLFSTSGTTGEGKFISKSYDLLMSSALDIYTTTQHRSGSSPYINLMSFQTSWGFNTALGAFIHGDTYFVVAAEKHGELLDIMNNFSIKYIQGSPAQLNSFTKFLNKNSLHLSINCVSVGGARFPLSQIELVKKHLSKMVICGYGSAEAGVVAQIDSADSRFMLNEDMAAGEIAHGVSVEIVDADHQLVEDGTQGIVRVKTPYMVDRYYDNTLHNNSFNDGWFYPGDVGYMMNSVLYLSGRTGDVINKGGVKINPAAIEDFSITYPSIEDVAVIKVFNADGAENAAVLLVISGQKFDFDFFKAALLKKFGVKTPSYIYRVNKIPRNQNGKVLKNQLTDKFTELIRQQA